MKKTLITKGGKTIGFYVEKHTIYSVENDNVRAIGSIDEEDNVYLAHDRHDELNISASGEDESKAFDMFCEQYTGHLEEREEKRAEFIDSLRSYLDDLEKSDITDDYSAAIQDIYRIVKEYTSDGNGEV